MSELPAYDEVAKLLRHDPETGALFWRVFRGGKALAGTIAGTAHPDGNSTYTYLSLYGRQAKAHRVAWLLHYRAWPDGPIDHINGNGQDNRICNLRLANKSQNAVNAKRLIPRLYDLPRGVQFDKRRGCYYAQGTLARKLVYLGTFKAAEDASAAYQAWAKTAHGEFIRES